MKEKETVTTKEALAITIQFYKEERERRLSSENVLKRFDKISELELRRVVWEHFEKYKSHQSENNK